MTMSAITVGDLTHCPYSQSFGIKSLRHELLVQLALTTIPHRLMLAISPSMNHNHPTELLTLMSKAHGNMGANSPGVKISPDRVKDILKLNQVNSTLSSCSACFLLIPRINHSYWCFALLSFY